MEARIVIPEASAMNDAQRTAAENLINGPRKAIFGPFIPLLQTPMLMECIGKTGETLRFHGSLPDRIRELVICIVARETSNQFEWQIHVPNALNAGVSRETIDSIDAGRALRGLSRDEQIATDFSIELLRRNGVSDATYSESVSFFGVPGTVELTALVGYFVMVCWIMNVAKTPGPVDFKIQGLTPFPA